MYEVKPGARSSEGLRVVDGYASHTLSLLHFCWARGVLTLFFFRQGLWAHWHTRSHNVYAYPQTQTHIQRHIQTYVPVHVSASVGRRTRYGYVWVGVCVCVSACLCVQACARACAFAHACVCIQVCKIGVLGVNLCVGVYTCVHICERVSFPMCALLCCMLCIYQGVCGCTQGCAGIPPGTRDCTFVCHHRVLLLTVGDSFMAVGISPTPQAPGKVFYIRDSANLKKKQHIGRVKKDMSSFEVEHWLQFVSGLFFLL